MLIDLFDQVEPDGAIDAAVGNLSPRLTWKKLSAPPPCRLGQGIARSPEDDKLEAVYAELCSALSRANPALGAAGAI
jgi:hypothetical protein